MDLKYGPVSEDIEVHELTATASAAVYIGGLTRLTKVNELLQWRFDEELAAALHWGLQDAKVLRLSEIAEQLPSGQVISVIVESPLHGEIYQYGNYHDGKWYQIGSTHRYE